MQKILEKRGTGSISILVCLLLFLSAALIQPSFAAEKVLEENLDVETLKLMAGHGQLIHLSYDGEELTYRTVMTLVNAPLNVVWKVISNAEKYVEFVPQMQSVEVLDKKGGEITVEHTVKIKIVGPIAATEKYSTRYVFDKPKVVMYDPEKPEEEPGYWELVPVNDGKKTLLIYFDKAPNLEEMGTVVRTVLRTKPELGLALQVSPVSILTKAMKARAEKLAKGKK